MMSLSALANADRVCFINDAGQQGIVWPITIELETSLFDTICNIYCAMGDGTVEVFAPDDLYPLGDVQLPPFPPEARHLVIAMIEDALGDIDYDRRDHLSMIMAKETRRLQDDGLGYSADLLWEWHFHHAR